MKYKQMKRCNIDEISIDEFLIQSELIKMLDKKMIFFVLYQDKLVYVNDFFEISLGYTKDELINKKIEDIIDEEFKNTLKEHENNREYCKIKTYRKGGQMIWLDACVKSLKLKEKEIIMVLACEVTEYVQMKENLKIKEQQYCDILNNQTDLILRATMDHRYIFANDAYCDYFEIKRENLIGEKSLFCIFEEDRKKMIEALKLATIDNPFVKLEMRAYKKDGTLAWIEWTGCVFYNESGEPIEYQGIGRDFEKRKNSEEALKKLQDELQIEIEKRTYELNKASKELMLSNSYMKSILMNMSEGVVIIDELGNLKNLNGALEKNCIGYTEDIEKYFKNMILKGQNNNINKMFKEKKSFYGCELMIPTTKGNLQLLISGDPINDFGDNVNKGVIIVRTIKEVHEMVNRFSGAQARFDFSDIITKNKKMLKIVKLARRTSLADASILIQGESGTGKELFAQAIHNNSKRCNGPFIAVNCGAIPRELIGSELFGYTEGSFTGAKKGGKPGKFELASGGTVFLDEIGDMPFEQQAALLRVIQEKKIMRIGGNREIAIDVRIVCATNKDLFKAMKNGSFRDDLYYRLDVISIKIPPLRERREDISLLFEYFIKRTAKNGETLLENMDTLVMEYLKKYNWYGNVRELENAIERIIHTLHDDYITVDNLPENILKYNLNSMNEINFMLEGKIGIKDTIKKERAMQEKQEMHEIMKLFKIYKGNVSKVAREMGISRSTLYRRMEKYKK